MIYRINVACQCIVKNSHTIIRYSVLQFVVTGQCYYQFWQQVKMVAQWVKVLMPCKPGDPSLDPSHYTEGTRRSTSICYSTNLGKGDAIAQTSVNSLCPWEREEAGDSQKLTGQARNPCLKSERARTSTKQFFSGLHVHTPTKVRSNWKRHRMSVSGTLIHTHTSYF